MMLRDDIDFDQSSAHIWTEHGQIIAVIWGEDGVEAGSSSPNLDVGHLVLPTTQEWIDPAYSFEKGASPEIVPMAGGTVTFTLKATASYFAEVENMVFTDTLPVNWMYVDGSTVITYPNGLVDSLEPITSTKTSTIAGSQVVTQTVLFWDLGTNLTPKQSVVLQFQATVSNPISSIGPRHFDGFESNTYDGGIGPWLDNWTERLEPTNDPTSSGNIRITDAATVKPYSGDRQLLIEGGDHAIDRGIDLSNFAQPILRFKRYLRDVDETNDKFRLEISSDGGASYTPVLSWTSSSLQGMWLQEEIDLSPYFAPTARLRFASMSSTSSRYK